MMRKLKQGPEKIYGKICREDKEPANCNKDRIKRSVAYIYWCIKRAG